MAHGRRSGRCSAARKAADCRAAAPARRTCPTAGPRMPQHRFPRGAVSRLNKKPARGGLAGLVPVAPAAAPIRRCRASTWRPRRRNALGLGHHWSSSRRGSRSRRGAARGQEWSESCCGCCGRKAATIDAAAQHTRFRRGASRWGRERPRDPGPMSRDSVVSGACAGTWARCAARSGACAVAPATAAGGGR